MNEHLRLGNDLNKNETIEQPFEPLTVEEMTVWTGDHAKPSGDQVGDAFERRLLREMDERSQKDIDALTQKSDGMRSLSKRNIIVSGALETMIGWKEPTLDDLEVIRETPTTESYGTQIKGSFVDKRTGLIVSGVFLIPSNATGIETCVFVSKNGVADYFDEQGKPVAEVAECLAAGKYVGILDLYGQGANSQDGVPLEKAPKIGYGDAREPYQQFVGYNYGYNQTYFSRRVSGLLTVLSYSAKANASGHKVTLYGLKGGAHYAAAARALIGKAVDEMIVNTDGFRFANIETLDDIDMLPGIVKYGDLPAILSLSAPLKTEVHGEP